MKTINTDLVVVGGGIAGFAAAIGASETGCEVVMIEKNNQLGGNATLANVGTVCGAFYRKRDERLNPVGYHFTVSTLLQLCDLSNTTPILQADGLIVVPYEWSMLHKIIDQKLEHGAVKLLTSTTLAGAEKQDKTIQRLTVVQEGKPIQITPMAVIDCSGNGIVSQLLGLQMLQEETYQAASQIFRVQNLESPGEYQLTMAIKRAIARLSHENQWAKNQQSLSVVPGSLRDDHVDLKLTLPDLITDDTTSNDAIRSLAHKRVNELFPMLKRTVGYLSASSIHSIFPQLGIRVMRRSRGKYVLTEKDVLTGKKFDDAIAVGTWPIEEWGYDGKVTLRFSDTPDGYDIPASCLKSSALENLYFAGKNISASTAAIGSARVMGTCLQTGYAAGRIASGKTSVQRHAIIQELNRELSENRI